MNQTSDPAFQPAPEPCPLCLCCPKPAKPGKKGCCAACFMAAYRRVRLGDTWDSALADRRWMLKRRVRRQQTAAE